MDITQMRIDTLNSLTIQHGLQAEHTVSSRVLRTDIDHVVVGAEKFVLLSLQIAILVEVELQTVVGLYIILKGVLIVELPVLAEGIALEIATQEQTTHILMTQEHDAIEIEDLALQQIGYFPDV